MSANISSIDYGSLGFFYLNGRGGLPQDYVQAYLWYALAVAQGVDASKSRRDSIKKDYLTSTQVAAAQRLVRSWRPKFETVGRRGSNQKEASRPPSATPKVISSGTGFLVNRLGVAVTNAHVVEGCARLKAHLPNKSVVDATVVARDKQNDVAAVKLSEAPARWAKFRSNVTTRAGDEAVAFGFPLSGTLASGGNVTTGNISAMAGLHDDTRYYQITVPVQPGNSGGPLLDDSGNVIGVITSKLNALRVVRITGDIPQNVNFALKAFLVKAFLSSNDIAFETNSSKGGLSAADVGESAKRFTVRLESLSG